MTNSNSYHKYIHDRKVSLSSISSTMDAVFSNGIPFRFYAPGKSMSPCILDGDIITLSPVNKRISIGDIVALKYHGNRIIVHRVIQICSNFVVTKGDNSIDLDDKVDISKIIGVVQLIERRDKNVTWGLGKEKVIFAWLSRNRILIPITRIVLKFSPSNYWR